MNKTAIKNYAIWARVQLIEAAKQRAFEYAITDGENDPNLEIINGRILSSEEKNQRAELISLIKQKGFEQVMEEAAYTWFNRFIALRFMEVNGFLPTKVRVFTDENGEFKPQILKEAMTVDFEGIDREKILGLIEKQDNEELFKYLIIAQCNALSSGLPGMFETISNWTELLFPANLLKADSVIGQMITTIPEEDWTDQVQIIGWLYQYYNSELKDDTFAKLKKNIKISKERIPAATQLFTPDWIVRYMVENSLGRLWYEGHTDFDKSEWKYYLDEAEQEPEVEEELKKIRAEYAQIKPEEIKIIDPCMGSGHILVYAFDVLMQIYTSAGWSERDAAKSILENNLFGIDIDDRAGQLAYFAVMMKARKYNRRILNGEVRPKVLSIQESNGIDINLEKLGPEKAVAQKLIKDLKDAKEYGSILNLSVKQEELDALKRRLADIDEMSSYGSFLVQHEVAQTINSLYPLIELAEIMIRKYDVVVTNPPYMGASGMSNKLSVYIKDNYSDSKSDLFAVFIEKCMRMVKAYGYQAMITQHAWMFLSSFEKLRKRMLSMESINMAHLGARAFDDISGEVVQTTSFVLCKKHINNYLGVYIRLVDSTSQNEKEGVFLSGKNRFITSQDNYYKIPGAPVAYWISAGIFNAMNQEKVTSCAMGRIGLATGRNDYYLRLWFEVNYKSIGFGFDRIHAKESGLKWFPYNKGGSYRKWYGNRDYIINWLNDGKELQTTLHPDGHRIWAHNFNLDYIFKKCLAWSDINTGKMSFRAFEKGFLFDSSGTACFVKDNEYYNVLGYLNTKFVDGLSRILNPTFHFTPGDFACLPYVQPQSGRVEELSKNNIYLCELDWDSFETSWDFKKHPLI